MTERRMVGRRRRRRRRRKRGKKVDEIKEKQKQATFHMQTQQIPTTPPLTFKPSA